MFNKSQAAMQSIVLHHIGNKANEEGIRFSRTLLSVPDPDLNNILMNYFTTGFKNEVFYNFYHPLNELDKNLMYSTLRKVFDDPELLLEQSVIVAEQLYNCSNHPKIKSGELYMVYFTDLVVEDELTDAIGIFKSENKETYLKIFPKGEGFGLLYEDGINIQKLDKGCIVFNTEADLGYKIVMVDNINKNSEAQYWKDEFMQVKPRPDNFYATTQILDICKGFCEQVLVPENQIEKQEQIEFAQKTAEYFQTHEAFDQNEFEKVVIDKPKLQKAFNDYKNMYVESNEIELDESFDIAPGAAKNAKKYFKSVIKLDKNFHVYVHAKPEFIEKGYDEEKEMNFYKLFYNEEN